MKTRTVLLALAAALLSGCLNRVAWMPDGSRLVYVQTGPAAVVWLITLEGTRTKLAEIPGLADPEVSVSPRDGLVAVAGKLNGTGLVRVIDEAGTQKWSGPTPSGEANFVPGSWSEDGRRLLVWAGKSSLLVDLSTGAPTAATIRTGDAARISASGDVVWLAVSGKAARLERRTAEGTAGKAATWKLPAGIAEPSPLLLNAAADAAWWKGKSGKQEVCVLAGADGRILFTSTRTLVAAGPDGKSYVTDDGGYAIMGAGREPVNLNPLYNALLRMDLNWQLADPAAAAVRYDADALVKSAPAFSPDGTRIAVLTPNMVCIGTIATGEVLALAKW